MVPKKKQKVDDNNITYKEEVLFNSDTLSKIISYLPSKDVLNLALTCMRFGVSNDDDESLIEKSICITIKDTATEEQQATLSCYNGENSLADYHYLQSMREPLTFDQLVGAAEYVNEEDKTCVRHNGQTHSPEETNIVRQVMGGIWGTAISNNIMRVGKHYVSFTLNLNLLDGNSWLGVIRPGEASQSARGLPVDTEFFIHFSRNMGHDRECSSRIDCCFYNLGNGFCHSKDWEDRMSLSSEHTTEWNWDGIESGWQSCNRTESGWQGITSGLEIGMLLDLDEGTISIYKNGLKLGVMKSGFMKRGLAGPYCWAVSMIRAKESHEVRIKRVTTVSR